MSGPQKYRKRPLIVDAWQFQGFRADDNGWGLLHWVDEDGQTASGLGQGDDSVLIIETREGRMRAEQGDWIVKEPAPTSDRRFYPVKPDIFAATYEAVSE